MAYSKQNFQDGQILTAANLEKMENGIIAGQGAENLLDNSDFSNYINSRGGISTAGVWDYCIDRWRAFGTAGQLVWHNSDHVALGALRGINQEIKNKSRFVGKTYTLAAKDADGTLYITSGTYGGDSNHIWKETNGMELRLYSVSDDDNIYFSLKNLSSDTSKFIYLKWAALYEGAYDESTLPPYVPKGKHVEMLNCNVPIAPHNLLDNSDFRNPVNQRGQTSYSGTIYGIDRWKGRVVYQTVSVRTTDITITATGTSYSGIIQKIGDMSKLAGKTITFAANVWSNVVPNLRIVDANGNTLASVDGTAQTTQTLILTYTVPSDATSDSVIPTILCRTTASGDYIRLYWAALYEGSYDASTLPAYQPKGYAAELAECQRYYQIIPEQTSCAFSTSAQSNKYFASSINFSPMRITPTVTLKKDSNGYVGVVQGVAFVSASEFDFAYKLNGTLLPATTNANYAGKVMSFYGVELSADL